MTVQFLRNHLGAAGMIGLLCVVSVASAQDHDRDYRSHGITQLVHGTVIPIRTTERIDVERRSNMIYNGVVDQDVRGDDGRLAIPRGSTAELIVRVARDNDLILDLESVTVNGVRYAIKTDVNRFESRPDNSLVGAIVGAINGGQTLGRAVRVPRDTVVTFRLERPMDMNVADRGIMREGHHYHDYYDHDYDRH